MPSDVQLWGDPAPDTRPGPTPQPDQDTSPATLVGGIEAVGPFTGAGLVAYARRFLGEPYSTAPGRDSPTSGHKDCSGLIAASYLGYTGRSLGANVSVTIYSLGRAAGLTISRTEADAIAGACYLMPENPDEGWGPKGHIGFSDGHGGTVEATPPSVQALSNRYQPWGSHACLLPGIDYGLTPDEEADMNADALLPILYSQADGNHDQGRWWICSPITRTRVHCRDAPAAKKEAQLLVLRTAYGTDGGPVPVPKSVLDGYTIVAAP